MKVTVERDEHPELVVVLEDVDLALVNAVRRVVLAEVPHVAVSADSMTFSANTCVLHNHFLAHRISMAPIHLSRVEADAYIPGSIKVHLDVENQGKRPLDVTTADLKVTLHDQPHPDTKRLYPASPVTGDHVLLTVLKPGERVAGEGTVVKGSGHAAFGVVSKVAFTPLLDDAAVAARRADVPDELRAQNRFEHIDRKRCWTAGPDGNPRAFRFVLETECGMTAPEILDSALAVLERKCSTAKAVPLPDASVQLAEGELTALEVPGEGHTLGNLLQSAAMDELFGKSLAFVGYVCPHPLEKRVVFKVRADDPMAAFEEMKGVALGRVQGLRHLVVEALARARLDDGTA